MATHAPRLLLKCAGAALLAAALFGCGAPSTVSTVSGNPATAASPSSSASPPASPVSSSTAGSQGQAPQLACVIGTAAHPIDTISLTLTCTVTHAPASETVFMVHDIIVNKVGQSYTLSPACRGTIVSGSGHCAQTYSVPAPLSLENGTITGSTQPRQYLLGPVAPTTQPSPEQTPSIPFVP